MLVARVIAKVEPGGAPLGALRLVRALRAHGVGSRLFVGEATRRGLRLLDDAGVDFEVRGRGDDELQYACDERFATWLRPRLAGADLVHAHMFGAAIAAVRAEEGGIDLDGAQRYAARFSPERVASQYARIYRRLLAGLVAEVAIAA